MSFAFTRWQHEVYNVINISFEYMHITDVNYYPRSSTHFLYMYLLFEMIHDKALQ